MEQKGESVYIYVVSFLPKRACTHTSFCFIYIRGIVCDSFWSLFGGGAEGWEGKAWGG